MTRPIQRVAEDDQDCAPGPEIGNDRSLLTAIANGDERALEMVFLAHAGRLHRLAHRYLGSSWAAQAVVQDVFTALWTRRGSIKVRGPLAAYLAAAVRNRAQSVIREEVRRRERDARWAEGAGPASAAEPDAVARRDEDEYATGVAALDAQLRNGVDVRAMVERVLAELPARQRLVFRLRVEQHMSNLEVQDAIGAVSPKAVERLFARAVKMLRARLVSDSSPVAPVDGKDAP